MWKCPICSNDEKNEYVCQICGYDVRKDFVCNRTIQPVPSQDVKTFAKRISDYDEAQRKKAEEAARALLEVIKREQEKKAEAERIFEPFYQGGNAKEYETKNLYFIDSVHSKF